MVLEHPRDSVALIYGYTSWPEQKVLRVAGHRTINGLSGFVAFSIEITFDARYNSGSSLIYFERLLAKEDAGGRDSTAGGLPTAVSYELQSTRPVVEPVAVCKSYLCQFGTASGVPSSSLNTSNRS